VGSTKRFNLVEKGIGRTKTWKLMSAKFKLGPTFQQWRWSNTGTNSLRTC